jgi:hypothetical protein
MMHRKPDTDIAGITSELRDKIPWGVRLGQGSFITMEFGKARKKTSAGSIIHGEWHLWLYMCNWRIELPNKILAGSDDSRERIQKVLESATFDKVTDIRVASPSLDLTIQFGSKLKILTFSSSRNELDQWWLFTRDGNCLAVHGGGKYTYGSENQPRGNAQ